MIFFHLHSVHPVGNELDKLEPNLQYLSKKRKSEAFHAILQFVYYIQKEKFLEISVPRLSTPSGTPSRPIVVEDSPRLNLPLLSKLKKSVIILLEKPIKDSIKSLSSDWLSKLDESLFLANVWDLKRYLFLRERG